MGIMKSSGGFIEHFGLYELNKKSCSVCGAPYEMSANMDYMECPCCGHSIFPSNEDDDDIFDKYLDEMMRLDKKQERRLAKNEMSDLPCKNQ